MKKLLSFLLLNFAFLIVEAQIPSYLPTNGLVGWWPFNGNANDESGNGNNGIVNGATLTTDRFGNEGNAFSFDGINDFIDVNIDSILQNGISICLWFSYANNQFDHKGIIWSRLSGPQGNYPFAPNQATGIMIHPNGMLCLASDGSNLTGVENTGMYFNDGNWNQVVFTLDVNSHQSKIFINGMEKKSVNSSNTTKINLKYTSTKIGKDEIEGYGNRYWNGKIDDIAIYNRALTPQEITQLYTGVATTYADVINNNDTTICKGNTITLSAKETLPVTDIDGNEYPTVKIGSQIWTAKNLDVSRYRNGDSINYLNSGYEWINTNRGAVCNYNNDSNSFANTYGKLYNWFAVDDIRKLAPQGWHVPSDGEWNKLVKFIDNNIDTNIIGLQGNSIGRALKETGTLHWEAPNSQATNSSLFYALPGGYRYSGGDYMLIGNTAIWWTSTNNQSYSSWNRVLTSDNSFYRVAHDYRHGFSVRLVKDNHYSYLWSNGDTTATISISPNQTTTYYCTITDGVNSYRDSVKINVFNPNIFPQDTLKICGSSYTLDAGSGYNSYLWNTSDSSQSINVTSTGWYSCTVSNGICSATDSVLVSIIGENIINNDTTICKGSSITLTTDKLADIDGNDYPIAKIGTQKWISKNLNVSRYKNGDIIPQVSDSAQWSNLTSGAWCWYNNDSVSFGAINGKLYNWYAVNDSRGLAPEGWHVPSDGDWKKLIKYLDINFDSTTCCSSNAGGKMKTISGWASPNIDATNSSGFTALPGGYRNGIEFNFFGSKIYSCFWSCTQKDEFIVLGRSLINDNGGIYNVNAYKNNGFSVRLVKDIDYFYYHNNNYLWNNGATTSIINVNPASSTTYYCTTSNGIHSCRDSVTVTVIKPAPTTSPASITITPVNTNVCEEKVYRYSAPALPAATSTTEATGYLWSFTGNLGATAIIDSGTLTSRAILLRFLTNAASATGDSVRVCYTSACGKNSPNKSVKLTNTQTKVPAVPASITVTQVAPSICSARVYRFTAPALVSASGTAVSATGWKWSFTGSLAGDPFTDTTYAVVDSGTATSQVIRVRFKTNAAAVTGDSIRVCYNSGCGYTANKSLKLANTKLNVPATPASITVTRLTTNICGARKYRYTAPTLSALTTTTVAATGYQWSFTGSLAGDVFNDTTYAVIDSGNINSRIIVVRYKQNNAAATGDSIRLLYTSDCGNSVNKAIKLTNALLSVPAVPASITITSITTNVCSGKVYRYTAPVLPAATSSATAATSRKWVFKGRLFSNYGQITLGNDTSRIIEVTYSSNIAATIGDSVLLYYTSACGNSLNKASKLSNVATTLPAAPASITPLIVSDVCGARVYRYTAPILPTATAATATVTSARGYLWTMPIGAVGSTGNITTGSDTSRIIEITYRSNAAAQAGDTIKVRYTTITCGNSAYKGLKLTNLVKNGCPPSSGATIPTSRVISNTMGRDDIEVKVFPNPTHNNFNLQINTLNQSPVDVSIMDVQGKLIKRLTAKPNEISSIGNDLQSGVYLIKVVQGKQIKTVKVVKE